MVLIEKAGHVYINEQAREKLQALWPRTYTSEFISIKSSAAKGKTNPELCRAQQRSLTRSRTPTFLGGFGL
jgi:hypothetical protein